MKHLKAFCSMIEVEGSEWLTFHRHAKGILSNTLFEREGMPLRLELGPFEAVR